MKKEVEELSTAKASLVSKLEDIEKSYSQEDEANKVNMDPRPHKNVRFFGGGGMDTHVFIFR